MKKITAFFLKALSSPKIQDSLLKFLNEDAIKYLIVSVLKISGFKAWIVTILAEEVIEEADEHIIEPLFNGVGYYGDALEGATIYKKVKNAEDVDEWINSLNDV